MAACQRGLALRARRPASLIPHPLRLHLPPHPTSPPQIYSQSSLDGEARVLIDPNTLSQDGTVALGGQAFSEDGTLCAYMLSSGGSDWRTIRVKRVDQGTGEATGEGGARGGGAGWGGGRHA
jgi:protease II